MNTILFEPHLDDAVLFASYTLLRHKPLVITVFGDSRVQERYGIHGTTRLEEHREATRILNVKYEVWDFRDDGDDDPAFSIYDLAASHPEAHCFAPAVEAGGHVQHSYVGAVAEIAFRGRITHYLTYVRGQTRTRSDREVPFEPDWPAKKLKAMACYTSQINLDNTRPWFSDWDREWYQ